MPQIFCFVALVAFIIGGGIVVIDDTLDLADPFLALFVGLAFWVGSTLVPER